MNIQALLKKKFQGGEVAAVFDEKTNTLARWVDRALVKPTWPDAQGPGTRNGYSFEDIIRIGFMRALAGRGHSLKEASSLAFESAEESDYGGALARAISDCIEAWARYAEVYRYAKGLGGSAILSSVPSRPPDPVYFVFFKDESGKLATIYAQDGRRFAAMYRHLADTDGAGIVNLMTIIHKALLALAGH